MSNSSVFSSLRAYALSGKRLWLLLVILCLGVVLPVADLYQATTITAYALPPPLVYARQSPAGLARFRLATGARASSIASDLVVLLVTLHETYRFYRSTDRTDGPTLTRVLFEHGFVYFVVLFLFNLCDIIVLQISVNGAIADFVTVFSVILVARFLLRLREVGTDTEGSSLCLSSVEIRPARSALGSLVDDLGQSLDYRDVDVGADEADA
ncbi:hypothetical protein BD414DRAFT_540133 [Trametes punicea]|nr:hypothetical protein BD414DRAFT_540133 [Trametes punicea]